MRSRERNPFRSRRRSLTLWLGWPLLLAGCTVGPNYQPPATKVPVTWEGLSAVTPSQTSVPTPKPVELVDWWKTFQDPTLTVLVEKAVAANLDLRQAQARVRQARAARSVAAAGLWPTLDASASYSRIYGSSSGASSGSPTLPASGPSARDLFLVGLDAAWELDIFGGVRRDIEAAEGDLQAAVENLRDVLVSLVAEVGGNYLNLRGFQQQLAIARKNLQAQQHTADITRKRYEAGFANGLDVANASAQVATTASQLPLLESSARAAIYSLSILLGNEPAALVKELSTEAPIPPTPPEVPVGLPSDLLRRRPDIRRAEAQLHAATARIGVATADLFPRFSLSGSLGLASQTLSALTDWGGRFWSAGSAANWLVFDAGRVRGNIEIQDALQEQALLAYQRTVLTALQDTETALVAYSKEQERKKSLSDAVRNNRKAVDLAMKLYIAGRTDFLNVLDAQRSLYISEDALVQSTRSEATVLIALYKALGGGWEKT
jgi:multidrug efflux system outer membrane protein